MKETQVAETTLVAFSPEAGAGEGRNGPLGRPSSFLPTELKWRKAR
jgi:hypothetical protein